MVAGLWMLDDECKFLWDRAQRWQSRFCSTQAQLIPGRNGYALECRQTAQYYFGRADSVWQFCVPHQNAIRFRLARAVRCEFAKLTAIATDVSAYLGERANEGEHA